MEHHFVFLLQCIVISVDIANYENRVKQIKNAEILGRMTGRSIRLYKKNMIQNY